MVHKETHIAAINQVPAPVIWSSMKNANGEAAMNAKIILRVIFFNSMQR